MKKSTLLHNDNLSLSREILVIDDRKIREKYFSEAERVLFKIDQMEEKIRSFHSTDQRLFDQWYRQTFQKDQARSEALRNELKELSRFHNWVVATAIKLDIEMHQAYALMKEEERRYEAGTSEDRHQIELDRERRDQYISSEINSRYNDSHEYETEEDDNGDALNEQFGQILSNLEEMLFSGDVQYAGKPHEQVARIMDLPDEELKYWLRDQEAAFLLFDVSLSWGERQRDYAFFLRVWKLMSNGQKHSFSKVYASLTGQTIEELIDRIDTLDEQTSFEFDEESDPLFESFDFEEPGSEEAHQRDQKSRANALEQESLKNLYRKLVRKLHPDLHHKEAEKGDTKSWTGKIWELVQSAYLKKDVDSLKRLFQVTLLRTHALDQLTLDEIHDARKWLEKDLTSLKREAGQLKKSWAWGFSQKKDFSALTRKIKEEFQQGLSAVQYQLQDLQRELGLLEVLYTMEPYEKQRSRSRRKSSSQATSQRRRSPGRRNREQHSEY